MGNIDSTNLFLLGGNFVFQIPLLVYELLWESISVYHFSGHLIESVNHHGGNYCNYGTTRLKYCENSCFGKNSIPYIPYSESTPWIGM